MSSTKLDVELDLEAIKKENEEELKLANKNLTSLKKDLEDAQKIIQESPQQIEQLKKKLGDAHYITTLLENDFKILDEEDEDEIYYAEEKRKVEEAQRNERSIEEQLKTLNQKFDQAKKDEIRLKKEFGDQQNEVQKLERIIKENKKPQTETFQSQQTKSFGDKNGNGKASNKDISDQKSKDVIKHFKFLCDTKPNKYRYNEKKQEVVLSGKGGIISFTKNGASTNSTEPDDIKSMASDLFNAYIKDENDLKTVKFNASGPKEKELNAAIAELKAAKLKEFQQAKLNKTESRLNVDEETSQRFARAFTSNQ